MVLLVRSLTIVAIVTLISSSIWGQQPKRKRELYIAPLLPAEQAWKVSLPAAPAAGAAMDSASVYVPVVARTGAEDGEETPARFIALHRETGAMRWTIPLATRQPPLLTQGVVIVATATGLHALEPRDAALQWSVTLDKPVRAPMLAQGPLVLALLEGDELAAIDLQRHDVAWRRSIGESGSVLMTADAEAAYLTTEAGRVMRVTLSDGKIAWEQKLEGQLSAPTIDRDRLFVGSNAAPGSLWALEARTGETKWKQSRVIGGAVVGAAVHGESVYAVSLDNMVRAFKRSNGNLQWDEPAARPSLPPRVLDGIVTVVGNSPTLSTFRIDGGAAVSTWDRPRKNSLLQGAPLIDPPAPFRVAIVVVFRDGEVIGLKPTGMLFKEPPPLRPTTLPGKELPRETLSDR